MKNIFTIACLSLFLTLSAQSDKEIAEASVEKSTIEGHIYFLADDLLMGRETGEPGNKIWSDNWAQLDEEDDPKISENCDPLVYDQLMPHVEKLNRMITRMKPGWSNSEPGDGPIVVANFFEVDEITVALKR